MSAKAAKFDLKNNQQGLIKRNLPIIAAFVLPVLRKLERKPLSETGYNRNQYCDYSYSAARNLCPGGLAQINSAECVQMSDGIIIFLHYGKICSVKCTHQSIPVFCGKNRQCIDFIRKR